MRRAGWMLAALAVVGSGLFACSSSTVTQGELGFTVARLDTGPRQPGARHLYESAGYVEIENFNANPVANYFGQKSLL